MKNVDKDEKYIGIYIATDMKVLVQWQSWKIVSCSTVVSKTSEWMKDIRIFFIYLYRIMAVHLQKKKKWLVSFKLLI